KWGKVPAGNHSVTALAFDSKSQKKTSLPVVVKVNKLPSEDGMVVEKPGSNEQSGDFSPLYINLGSGSSVDYDGNVFIPINKAEGNSTSKSQSIKNESSTLPLFQSSQFAYTLNYAII